MKPRRGMMLIELSVAAIIALAAMTLIVESLAWRGSQRHKADQRALTLIEANNLLERVTSLEWDQVTQEQLNKVELSPAANQNLSDAKIKFDLHESGGGPTAKRITVEIAPADSRERPVRLTAWLFRPASPDVRASSAEKGGKP
jgi:hypothetical protein